MTPTNLAALPSNQPIPNGRVQIKRGAADTIFGLGFTQDPQPIPDGGGGFMQISYTPRYPCYWVVHCNIMAHGNAAGGGWRTFQFSIHISPNDADGVSETAGGSLPVYDNTTVEWRTASVGAMFRLNAGTAYTAILYFDDVSSSNVGMHTGNMWCRIMGRIVGEGVL
jgi:hypothetical protein